MNMVKNGNFTDGLNHWTLTKESVKILTEDGKSFARVYNNGYMLYQRIKIERDKSYEFSCLARVSHYILEAYVGSRRLSKPNDTVLVDSIDVFNTYTTTIVNENDDFLDVFILVAPKNSNPPGSHADITDVSLVEKQ